MPIPKHVLGVDAAGKKWVGVGLVDGRFDSASADASLAKLVARYSDASVIAVDMPIGLPEQGRRACDKDARDWVGPRRSSVFFAPPPEALYAVLHADATKISVDLSGHGISQQAFALRAGIIEVAETAKNDPRIIEVHPEVSFRQLAGTPLEFSKHSLNGQRHRETLLRQAIAFPNGAFDNAVGRLPMNDVLDAAAAAWSAHRYAIGRAQSFPPGSDAGSIGTIWF